MFCDNRPHREDDLQVLGIPGNKIHMHSNLCKKVHLPQQVKLEETVKGSSGIPSSDQSGGVGMPQRRPPQVSLTPGGTTNQSVSDNSRSDYSHHG